MSESLDVGYDPAAWHDFFIATAGGVAALSGLIFVAVSVNLRTILDIEKKLGGRQLTGRALEALLALIVTLVISLVGLTPAISREALGALILLASAVTAVSPIRAARAPRTGSSPPGTVLARFTLAVLLTASLAVAGVSVLLSAGGGMYWLPVAFVIAVTVAAVNAWVLLVEVLR